MATITLADGFSYDPASAGANRALALHMFPGSTYLEPGQTAPAGQSSPGVSAPAAGAAVPGAAPTAAKIGDFTAPDPLHFTTDPSYQFRLNQGLQAMQNSAAARGTLLTGATAKGLQDYGQGAASQEYANAYQRALSTYGTNRDTAQANFGNQMSTFGGNLDAQRVAQAAQQAAASQAAQQQQFGLASREFDASQGQQALENQRAAAATAYGQSQDALNRATLTDQTAYERARQAWIDAGADGPLYGGYRNSQFAQPAPTPAYVPYGRPSFVG